MAFKARAQLETQLETKEVERRSAAALDVFKSQRTDASQSSHRSAWAPQR